MTSYVSQVSKSSLVKGFVYIQGNLTTHVRAREARLWTDAEAIRGETPEPEDAGDSRQKRIDRAKHRVMRKAPECLETFWLIIRNGRNRKESIWQMTKTTTSRERKSGMRRNTAIGTT